KARGFARALTICAPALLCFSGTNAYGPVTAVVDVCPCDLTTNPSGANWLSYNGDYSGRRYSSLAQITPKNVGKLRAQWVFHAPNHLEATPQVINGLMFVTSANSVFALDGRTGRKVWEYLRPLTEGLVDDASSHHNRGVALWRTRLFMETDNAHLL